MTNDAVAATELRVTVEMGDEYTPSDEIQAALNNLREALSAETDDVAGFGFESPVRNMTFTMGFGDVKMTETSWDTGKWGQADIGLATTKDWPKQ